MLTNVKGVKEPWAIITDELPALNTLWQSALQFRIKELFLTSEFGVFELQVFCIGFAQALERLDPIAAIALLDGSTQGIAVHLDGWRSPALGRRLYLFTASV